MTSAEIARAIMRASLALPTDHPVQAALDAAHGALLSTAAAHPQGVDNSRGVSCARLGREQG